MTNQHGERVQLPGLRGTTVLLVFYPYAFSGICTSELGELNAALPEIRGSGVRLAAVSVDTIYALRVFGDQLGLDFDLLSDFWPHGSVARQFQVFDERRGCAVRGSFLINVDGAIRWQTVNGLGAARNIPEHVRAVAGQGS